jgi:hypothetical protein
MIRRLGNFFLLTGLVCLVIAFSSSVFIFSDASFLVVGAGSTGLGLLLRRFSSPRNKRRKKKRRMHREEKDLDDK